LGDLSPTNFCADRRRSLPFFGQQSLESFVEGFGVTQIVAVHHRHQTELGINRRLGWR
jgi:hypothetical protein